MKHSDTKGYDSIIDFFGDEETVFCCLKKRLGLDAFEYLLENINSDNCLSDYLADVSVLGNVFFIKKSPFSKPNCILVKRKYFPSEISDKNVIILSKQDVIRRRDKQARGSYGQKNNVKKKVSKKDIACLKTMDYDAFLRTDYWRDVRLEKLRLSGQKCQICGATKDLHVHHNTYIHHGNEANHMEDLVVLCRDCHNLFHKYSRIKARKKR